MIRISDIQGNKVLWDSVPYCDIDENCIENYILKPNDILFARTGGTVGKSYLVKDVPEESIYAGYLIRTRYSNSLCPEYLKFFMESELYWIQIRNNTIATAQPNCNGKTLSNMLLPIPPLAEQKRIVAKIEDLLPYIEKYEQAETKLTALNKSFPEMLKKSILQEAVQGKLVPQNPDDEPASVLLERIRTEKQELIKQGKIKKSKHESIIVTRDKIPYEIINGKERCIADEVPFEIPESWEWCRWGNLSESIQYGFNAPAKESGRIKMVRISDIQDNKVLWESVPYCDIDDKNIETYLLEPNDILFARTGGTVGKSYLVKDVPEESIYAGYLIRTRYSNSLCPEYLKFFMESELYWIQIRNNTIATAQPNCNGKTLSNMLLPIPPLAEQKRIVAKIEDLLPYIEKYEQAETKLTALNKSFPEMLKKSILQEAVQGKLVPQNPDDEPASVLLERIRTEKQELIKQGKIKKSKHESIIVTRDKIPYEIINGKERCIADEVPFEIPESWEWCRVGSIFTLQAGKNISANQIVEDLVEGLYPCFGGNGIRGYVPSFNREGNYPIIGRQGALCGNINLANGQFYATEHAVCVKTFANTDVLWCCYFLTALNLNQYATATAQPGLAVANINEVFIPLPPLAEQKRIVEKINELMLIINSISK